MKNLATPWPTILFSGIGTLNRFKQQAKFSVLYFPLCWGRVYGLRKKPSGKSYHFEQVYLPLWGRLKWAHGS